MSHKPLLVVLLLIWIYLILLCLYAVFPLQQLINHAKAGITINLSVFSGPLMHESCFTCLEELIVLVLYTSV